MKKKLLHSILMVALFGTSCQQARLVEEWPDCDNQGANGRNSQAEQTDSVTVTPEFDIDGWEGSIDADFTFGGEETN